MANLPKHHKAIVSFLLEHFGEPFKVIKYRDDLGKRPIAVSEFQKGKHRFYSTVGTCDKALRLPAGSFEFAAMGSLCWLPNALISSVYWLRDRSFSQWPIVCEDVVRLNAKSRYRHMAFVPSGISFELVAGLELRWLLGVPITDSEISLDQQDVNERAKAIYPAWFFR